MYDFNSPANRFHLVLMAKRWLWRHGLDGCGIEAILTLTKKRTDDRHDSPNGSPARPF
jgi:hypothetical protein